MNIHVKKKINTPKKRKENQINSEVGLVLGGFAFFVIACVLLLGTSNNIQFQCSHEEKQCVVSEFDLFKFDYRQTHQVALQDIEGLVVASRQVKKEVKKSTHTRHNGSHYQSRPKTYKTVTEKQLKLKTKQGQTIPIEQFAEDKSGFCDKQVRIFKQFLSGSEQTYELTESLSSVYMNIILFLLSVCCLIGSIFKFLRKKKNNTIERM